MKLKIYWKTKLKNELEIKVIGFVCSSDFFFFYKQLKASPNVSL